jgi:hypothetical protein
MTPVDVNAYYAPWKNMIVFPAGILQTPYKILYNEFLVGVLLFYLAFSILIFLFHSISDRLHRLSVVSK